MIGARRQNPYTSLAPMSNPIFPDIATLSLSSPPQYEFPIDRKVGSLNSIREAVNIILKLAPKNIKDILGFSGVGSEGPIRQFIEPVGADKQCTNAGIIFKQGTSVCWLCGCVITEGGINKACEHIIPALRAIMLKGLITNKIITEKVYRSTHDVEQYKLMTKNNYLWAHADCNGSAGKGGMVLIDFDIEKRRFIPNTVQCALLDSKIRLLPNRNCYFRQPIDYTGVPNIVTSPYEAFIVEMEYQCQSINAEFQHFQGDIVAFSQYALNRAKLFITEAGSLTMLSDEEKARILAVNKANEQQLLLQEYTEVNEIYNLLQNDIVLSRQYLESEINMFKPYIKTQSTEQKIAYYDKAIELYLLYFNLESSENLQIKENVLNLLNSAIGRYLIETIPLEIMLTIIYILTQVQLFSSPNGEDKLMNTNVFYDLNQRIEFNRILYRFRKGRQAKNKRIDEKLKKILFINDDGTADFEKFNFHICDYISLFFVQYILYSIKISKPEFFTSGKEERSEITPIPVNITNDDLQELKSKIQIIPDYIKPYYDKIKEGSIFENLYKLFFSIGFNITICEEQIQSEVIQRFTDPGSNIISALDTATGLVVTRIANPENGYTNDEINTLKEFNNYLEHTFGYTDDPSLLTNQELQQIISGTPFNDTQKTYLIEYYIQPENNDDDIDMLGGVNKIFRKNINMIRKQKHKKTIKNTKIKMKTKKHKKQSKKYKNIMKKGRRKKTIKRI